MTELNEETWLPVAGYEGWYEVSDKGRVRRVKATRGAVPGRVLKHCLSKAGNYPVVALHKNNKSRTHHIHRLVLAAFRGLPAPGQEACHNNGDPTDNSLENLRWDSSTENNLDIVRMGRSHQQKKTQCPYMHPLEDPNLYWVGPDKTRRSCRACSRARTKATAQDREFDPSEADQFLQRFDPDLWVKCLDNRLFQASVSARVHRKALDVLDREEGKQ